MQEAIEKINETSSMTTYRIINRQTVGDVLKKLNLESKFFAVLINGHRVNIDFEVSSGDEILVLPKIAGG